MADTNQDIDPVVLAEERKMTREQAEDYAKRQNYDRSDGVIQTTLGHMGGAGASASGPDIAK